MTRGAHTGIFNSLCIANFPPKIPATPVCPLGMTWLCSLGHQSHSDWPQTSHLLPCPLIPTNFSTSGCSNLQNCSSFTKCLILFTMCIHFPIESLQNFLSCLSLVGLFPALFHKLSFWQGEFEILHT